MTQAERAPGSESDPIAGRRFALTGRFAALTQERAAEIIASLGGTVVSFPGRDTDYLVIGQEGWPLQDDGRVTQSLRHARELQAEGALLKVVSEQQFLELSGLAGDAASAELKRLYTTAQLSRVLGIPGPRIRSWVRRGLIIPADRRHGVSYFDFRQVAAIRMIRELTERGVDADTIRASLLEVHRWLPDAGDALATLTRMEDDGALVVRLPDGQLAETSGQLRLPVSSDGEDAAGPDGPEGPPHHTAGGWFHRAVALEDAGDLEAAARAYQRCLLVGGPDAEAAFNLGNVLSVLGRKEEAQARFREAVECSPDFVEAWNNMAGVLTELERFEDAVEAGERALDLAPTYPDAHFNLALALLGAGRSGEARVHGRIYLRHDPHSDWASQLRELLGLEES